MTGDRQPDPATAQPKEVSLGMCVAHLAAVQSQLLGFESQQLTKKVQKMGRRADPGNKREVNYPIQQATPEKAPRRFLNFGFYQNQILTNRELKKSLQSSGLPKKSQSSRGT